MYVEKTIMFAYIRFSLVTIILVLFSVNMNISEKLREFFPKKTQSKQINISRPTDFTKYVHVSYDPETKIFHGLPLEWEEQVRNLFP